MRKAPHELGPQPTRRSSSATRSWRWRLSFIPIHQERLADDIQQGHARIERGEGILKDHLHLVAQRLELVAPQAGNIQHRLAFGLEEDFSSGWGQRAQDAARGGGLAAAAFAYQGKGFTLVDIKSHIVHRPHVPDHLLPEALANGKEFLSRLTCRNTRSCSMLTVTPIRKGQGSW